MNQALTQEEAAVTAEIASRITTANTVYSARRLLDEASKLFADRHAGNDRALWALAAVYAAGIVEGKREERSRKKKGAE